MLSDVESPFLSSYIVLALVAAQPSVPPVSILTMPNSTSLPWSTHPVFRTVPFPSGTPCQTLKHVTRGGGQGGRGRRSSEQRSAVGPPMADVMQVAKE